MKPFSSTGKFLLGQGEVPLRRVAVRGASATVIGQGVVFVVQLLTTVVLARLLTPSDFGVMTMVTTFSLLFVSCGSTGLTDAIIQTDEITHQIATNLFWIVISIGIVLSAAFAAIGPLLAALYKDPRVTAVTAVMSLTVFLTSTSVIHLSLLKRAMMFKAASVNDIVARTVSVIVPIILAYRGWNYWALVAGAIAYGLATSIGAFYLCRWAPGLPRKAPGTWAMLKFAAHTYGRFSVNYAGRNLDNVLVGWFFGSHELGSYKKAYDLFLLPANQLIWPMNQVAVSTLSRLKANRELFLQYFLGALSVLAFIGMGMGGALTLVGSDTVLLLLGKKWEYTAHIFSFFGPGIGMMFLYATHGWLHVSIGRPDRWMRWGIIEFVVTAALFVICLHWGPIGLAIAWTTSFWVLTIPAFWYAGKPVQLRISSTISVVWRYVIASIIAEVATAGMSHGLKSLSIIQLAAIRIAVDCFVFTVLYVGAVILLHNSLAPVKQVFELLLDLLPISTPPDIAKTILSAPRPGERPVPANVTVPAASPLNRRPGEPLVSILIPSYNAENWIADTLQSAVAQTWKHKEIIVVDDGSSDRTVAIARQFECDGVQVIVQKNSGAAAARNHALSLSRGDFIQWLDADDILAPDKIEKQLIEVRSLRSPRVLLSSEWGRFMYRYYNATFRPTELWCDLLPSEWLRRKLQHNIYMQTATWLVSRELTDAAGPWNVKLLGDDDGEYFARVLIHSEGVRFVPDAKVYYRGPGVVFRSLSYIGTSDRKIEAQWISMKLHIGYLRGLGDSEAIREACLQYLRTWVIAFYPQRPDIIEEMKQIAAELGGNLTIPPQVKRRYYVIAKLFGWSAAKRAQVMLPRIRWTYRKYCEKTLFELETASWGRKARVVAPEAIAAKAQ